jgi:glycosyl hydrolase group 75 (putative chitosanase)
MHTTQRRSIPKLALLAVGLLAVAAVLLPVLTHAHRAYAAGPTASELLAKVQDCDQISNGDFATDDGESADIPVCGANGAVFWKADMDVDCDGQRTDQCNENTDPWYQDDTAFHQSDGQPLNAAELPYVVIPQNNSIFRYSDHDIDGGAVVAVIYGDQVLYAVFGDTGPTNIIGESSYATADALGIDPDPATGGADSGVTYIVFEGSNVDPIESHDQAVSVGEAAAQEFVDNN